MKCEWVITEVLRVKLHAKLILTHLLVGLLALFLVTGIMWWVTSHTFRGISKEASDALETSAYNKLKGFRTIKKEQINDFFNERRSDLGVLVNKVSIQRDRSINELGSFRDLNKVRLENTFNALSKSLTVLSQQPELLRLYQQIKALGANGSVASPDSSGYQAIWKAHATALQKQCTTIEVDNLHLIAAETPRIMFSLKRDPILEAQLSEADTDDGGMTKLCRDVVRTGTATMTDVCVPKDGNESAMFFACPLRDRSNNIVGILSVPLSCRIVEELLESESTSPATANIYIVGSDYQLRAKPKSTEPRREGYNTPETRSALNGQSGTVLTDNADGLFVFRSFAPINLSGGRRWAIIVEHLAEDAFASSPLLGDPVKRKGESMDFYAEFIQTYGYYDLFLFTPRGTCFHSVRHEDDYRTNLATGKYSKSQLGSVVKQVVTTKSFAFADYKPYAPSMNRPAAFIAAPIIDGDGIELIVGLQLNADKITNMVHKSGNESLRLESYLVGGDGLRRTDSFLDPEQTIEMSFRTGHPIETASVTAALAGQTQTTLDTNYAGREVLSAYTPVEVYGTRWALICEQDMDIALNSKAMMVSTVDRSIRTMVMATIGATTFVIVFVLIIALVVSKGISKPIVTLTDAARSFDASSNQPVLVDSIVSCAGEIGVLAKCFGNMQRSIRSQLERIRQNEENLRITLDSIGDAVIATDTTTAITRMNKVAEKLTGWTVDEARGKAVSEILTILNKEDKSPVESPVAKALETGEVVTAKEHSLLISKDKRQCLIADSAAPIRGDGAELHGVVLVFRDVTEEDRIQEHLRQSQKMEAVGQLVGGIAHDLNNMIGGIGLAAEMIKPHLGNDNQAMEYYGLIEGAVEHTKNLTRKLLTFARKQPADMQPMNVHQTLRDTMVILKNAVDKRIRIVEELSAASPIILGDASQLQAVFLNLGINASHAMPDGGELTFITKEIELNEAYCDASQFDLTPGDFLLVEICDTGCGIPSDIIHKIFDPFFTTKAPESGTGLGLSSALGTIQQHKGSITVYSEVGRGTKFHVLLPLSKSNEHIVRQKATPIPGSGLILIIEDELVMRASAKAHLERLGYDVLLAENGKEGLDTYRQHMEKIDVIILDMVMPAMNGRDCFYAIKDLNPDAKMILSSGFSLEEDVADMMDHGLCSTIPKPFNSVQLSLAIYRAMHPHQK